MLDDFHIKKKPKPTSAAAVLAAAFERMKESPAQTRQEADDHISLALDAGLLGKLDHLYPALRDPKAEPEMVSKMIYEQYLGCVKKVPAADLGPQFTPCAARGAIVQIADLPKFGQAPLTCNKRDECRQQCQIIWSLETDPKPGPKGGPKGGMGL